MNIELLSKFGIKKNILSKLNENLNSDEEFEGIKKISVSDKTYLCHLKHGDIVSAVNVDDLEDFDHDKHYRPGYLNVLFKELGSSKKLRVGLDGGCLSEESLYSIRDDDKYEWDWDLIKQRTNESDSLEKFFNKLK